MNADLQLAVPDRAKPPPAGSTVDISIIVPVYNEIESIPVLYHMLSSALEILPQSVEIIFCDDGSNDGSAAALDALTVIDTRVRVVHLRRNYGQTAAIMAAIQYSVGAVIVTMDSDGQNDPADIVHLIAKLDQGFDVVSGWRRDRKDAGLSRRLPSVIANRLISGLLGVPLHDFGCTLKAYRREVIEDVRLYGEMHRFIPIYASWEGAQVTELPVLHHARKFGRSKYGLGRIARVTLDLLMLCFIDRALDRPIQFFGKLGLIFFGFAILIFLWALELKFLEGFSLILTPLPLLAATIGLSGILFILLGLMTEVQMRTYFESRGKPPYKVRNLVQNAAGAPPPHASPRW